MLYVCVSARVRRLCATGALCTAEHTALAESTARKREEEGREWGEEACEEVQLPKFQLEWLDSTHAVHHHKVGPSSRRSTRRLQVFLEGLEDG